MPATTCTGELQTALQQVLQSTRPPKQYCVAIAIRSRYVATVAGALRSCCLAQPPAWGLSIALPESRRTGSGRLR
eukprot:5610484-Prymnesium_polylepis.1